MLNLLKSQRFRHHDLASFKSGPSSTDEFSPVVRFEKSSLPTCLSTFPADARAKNKSNTPPFLIPPKLLMLKCFQEGIHCTRQPATKEATEAWPNMVWRSIRKLEVCHPTQRQSRARRPGPVCASWASPIYPSALSLFSCSDTDWHQMRCFWPFCAPQEHHWFTPAEGSGLLSFVVSMMRLGQITEKIWSQEWNKQKNKENDKKPQTRFIVVVKGWRRNISHSGKWIGNEAGTLQWDHMVGCSKTI